jgi:hypothetical protein
MSDVPVPLLAKLRAQEQASSDCGAGGSGEDEGKRIRHPGPVEEIN